ncbi:ATP-binding protein [Thermodesulfobacteriota bacterium]
MATRAIRISFKNKILLSTFAVISLLSVGIALVTRFVIISSMTTELKKRGVAIGQSIAEQSRKFILTRDHSKLVSLVFDATQLKERKSFISYIFILDENDAVLCHTFTHDFPDMLYKANILTPGDSFSVRQLKVRERSAYDIAVPIMEGIEQIGTVHVGLNKEHIDHLIGNLRFTYLGTIFAIIILFFLISHWLSKYITRPISELTKLADEISHGNLDIKPNLGTESECWEDRNCGEGDCPAFENTDIPCWYVDETLCAEDAPCKFPEKLQYCYECSTYKKNVGDEVMQLADSFVNMTKRLRISQQQWKESEEKYRSLFDSGPNPVFVLDRETLVIMDVNESAQQTYGYPKEELIGRSFNELGAFEYEDAVRGDLQENGLLNYCVVSPRARHIRKNREPFYVSVHACPAKYQGKEVLIVVVTDITEMMAKDAQLVQANKMTTLGEMSAGIAHELNQPLNAIKIGNEYLKMMLERGENIPDEHLRSVAYEVSSQVDRATETINQLRQFGRKADFSKEKVQLNEVINNVLSIIGHQLSLQNIKIELDLDETIAPILAHKNRIEQVVFNLVTNARDAITQKLEVGSASTRAVIQIRSFMDVDRVAVSVFDAGIGIPEPTQERIFEPFFTTKEVGKGMGLGLSISYGIVKDYGGEIDVQSREGTGTIFKIAFPSAAL